MLLLACAVAGCDDDNTPTTPTPPAPTVTETFSGEVAQNGAATHTFSVAANGPVTATLKTIGADNTLVVSFSLGNWDTVNAACSVVLANDKATGGAVLSGTMSAAGTLCARVGDVGNIQAGSKAAYSIEVVHP
jgi:hypothetical protein